MCLCVCVFVRDCVFACVPDYVTDGCNCFSILVYFVLYCGLSPYSYLYVCISICMFVSFHICQLLRSYGQFVLVMRVYVVCVCVYYLLPMSMLEHVELSIGTCVYVPNG